MNLVFLKAIKECRKEHPYWNKSRIARAVGCSVFTVRCYTSARCRNIAKKSLAKYRNKRRKRFKEINIRYD
jgi:hypothetical protein